MKTNILQHQACGNTFRICLFYFLFTLSQVQILRSQCIATSARDAGTAVNDNSIGSISFSNPSRVTLSNDSRAAADALAVLFSGNSNYLKATNFGFAIPPTSGICGIQVQIEKRDGGFLSIGTGVRDNEVRLVINNSVTGNNKATTSTWPASPETFYTYGNASDLWGETLTPAIVNSPDFGVAISARFLSLATLIPSAQIDNIRMVVSYNPALPTHIISFDASLKNNIATVDWRTADEEVGEKITLQRMAVNENKWENVMTYDAGYGGSGKKYQYQDLLTKKGSYSYRIQITNINGGHLYSGTKNVHYEDDIMLNIYPNPAADFLNIKYNNPVKSITVSNLFLQSIKLPVLQLDNDVVRIDLRQLPKGMYFAFINDQQVKFIKN